MVAAVVLGFTVILFCGACAELTGGKSENPPTFNRAGEFTDRRGQAKIRLFTYTGLAEYADIKSYTEKLGCGMVYAYFYPAGTPVNEIPAAELQAAKSFTRAQEILFQGAGYTKWDYASQCIGFIPTVTDCRETPISTNCR